MRQLTEAEQKEVVQLLVRLAWSNYQKNTIHRARYLAVTILGLSDERPLDTKKRKAALNAFLAEQL